MGAIKSIRRKQNQQVIRPGIPTGPYATVPYSQAVRMGLISPNTPMPQPGRTYIIPIRGPIPRPSLANPGLPIGIPRPPVQRTSDISKVSVLTGLPEVLVRDLYQEFLIVTDKTAVMTKCNLKEILRSLLPYLPEPYLEAFNHTIFAEIDRDKNNTIDFWEFVIAYQAMIRSDRIFAPLLPTAFPIFSQLKPMENAQQLVSNPITLNNPLVSTIMSQYPSIPEQLVKNPISISNPLVSTIVRPQPYTTEQLTNNPLTVTIPPMSTTISSPKELQFSNPINPSNPIVKMLTSPTAGHSYNSKTGQKPIIPPFSQPNQIEQQPTIIPTTNITSATPQTFESMLAAAYSQNAFKPFNTNMDGFVV